MLMGFTTEGALRTSQSSSAGLRFVVSHVAYGSDGFDPSDPVTALALDPADTALTAEVFRKSVPLANTTIDTIEVVRGKETTYTTVGGYEFTSVLGEAGLIATVTEPGTSGLALGYTFLLVHAHFPRIHFSLYTRLAIKWPLQYFVVTALSAEDGSTLTTESDLLLETE
jgi:hypothetical protein